MKRREFISLLGGWVAWPLAARAQQQKSTALVMGLLSSRAPSESASLIAAFHEGLNEAGYVDGQNLAIAGIRVRELG